MKDFYVVISNDCKGGGAEDGTEIPEIRDIVDAGVGLGAEVESPDSDSVIFRPAFKGGGTEGNEGVDLSDVLDQGLGTDVGLGAGVDELPDFDVPITRPASEGGGAERGESEDSRIVVCFQGLDAGVGLGAGI